MGEARRRRMAYRDPIRWVAAGDPRGTYDRYQPAPHGSAEHDALMIMAEERQRDRCIMLAARKHCTAARRAKLLNRARWIVEQWRGAM